MLQKIISILKETKLLRFTMGLVVGLFLASVGWGSLHYVSITEKEKRFQVIEQLTAEQTQATEQLRKLHESMKQRVVERTNADGSKERIVETERDTKQDDSRKEKSSEKITSNTELLAEANEKSSKTLLKEPSRRVIYGGITSRGDYFGGASVPVLGPIRAYGSVDTRFSWQLGLGWEF